MEIIKYPFEQSQMEREISFLLQHSVSETAPLHTHDFFEMFLVTEGKALHLVNDMVQTIEQGDLIFIRPNDAHSYDFYQSFDFVFMNLAFTHKVMHKLSDFFLPQKPFSALLSSALPPVAKLSPQETSELLAEIYELQEISQTESVEYTRNRGRGFLANLFSRYFFSREHSDEPAPPKWLSKAVLEMQSIENFTLGFSRMVELCSCTPEHLCREFKRYYGTTPIKFINSQRLGYSLYLLSSTDMEIVDISEHCGFNNLSHFYHLFKDSFDISPNKFRKSKEQV